MWTAVLLAEVLLLMKLELMISFFVNMNINIDSKTGVANFGKAFCSCSL